MDIDRLQNDESPHNKLMLDTLQVSKELYMYGSLYNKTNYRDSRHLKANILYSSKKYIICMCPCRT